ncbi:MAG: hypothetical protein ACRCY4_04265 [Brevinema sp.]
MECKRYAIHGTFARRHPCRQGENMNASSNALCGDSALPTSCGSDIKITDGEITLGQGDFSLVEGGACVAQDVMTRLTTDVGALFYAPNFGEGIQRFLHASSNSTNELKACILRALQSEARVEANSESIVVSFDEILEAVVSFKIIDSSEKVNLTLRLGEELEIYQG